MNENAPRVFVEDWSSVYGSPYLVVPDDTDGDDVVLVEDGEELLLHAGDGSVLGQAAAFVDGVRRGEARLYLVDNGETVSGAAGAHGCGAVVVEPGLRARFERCTVRRLVIWGSGMLARLPAQIGGWAWSAHSIASQDPNGPLIELQQRMRQAEGELAEQLCDAGHLTVVDGPLNYVRSRDLPVIGLVKTHHRMLLPPELHARVPELGPGQRTSLFRRREDIYSAYLRLAPRSSSSGPWSGIVRIEIPASPGLAAARKAADLAAASLPRFAGVRHLDPRAPQNLQPIGALERQLRHLLGDAGLAERAVRSAVAQLSFRGGGTDS